MQSMHHIVMPQSFCRKSHQKYIYKLHQNISISFANPNMIVVTIQKHGGWAIIGGPLNMQM